MAAKIDQFIVRVLAVGAILLAMATVIVMLPFFFIFAILTGLVYSIKIFKNWFRSARAAVVAQRATSRKEPAYRPAQTKMVSAG